VQVCLMIEGQEGVTWADWLAVAEACERHGIPTLFRSDHYMNLDGQHPERGSLDAWGTLCALAAVTSKLRLGTLVSPAKMSIRPRPAHRKQQRVRPTGLTARADLLEWIVCRPKTR
jgi:hypothetical protein